MKRKQTKTPKSQMLVGSIWNLLPAERKLSSVGESKGENYEIKLMGKNGVI